MFGLAVLGVFAVYLLISLIVVSSTIVWAGRRKRNRLLWGFIALFMMYNLVFWDWLPTVYAHKYYCEKESGFWVYKTLEQWKVENPRVIFVADEIAISSTQKQEDGYTEVRKINQIFDWVTKHDYVIPILHLAKKEEILLDREKKNILVRYVDFSSGYGNFAVHNSYGISGFKFWLTHETCDGKNRINFETQLSEIYKLSEGLKK